MQVLSQAEQMLRSGLQLQPWAQPFGIKFYKTDIVHTELSASLLLFFPFFLRFIGCVCERQDLLLLILPLCCSLASS